MRGQATHIRIELFSGSCFYRTECDGGSSAGGSADTNPANANVSLQPQDTRKTSAPVPSPVIENSYSISWDNPLLPYGVIGALGGAFLLIGGYAGARRMKIAIPYVLACGTAVTLLLNPEILTEKHEKPPTDVIVAIDKSASQTAVKGRNEMTAAMQAELTQLLEGMGNVNIRVVEIDSASGTKGTQLFSAFNNLSDLDPRHVGAVIALTDGQISDVPESLPFPHGTPLHTILSGRAGEQDRVLKIESSPRYGLVGEEQTIHVIAEDQGEGALPGQPVTLHIKEEGEEIRTIETTTGQSTEVKLKLGHSGPNVISIEAEGLTGELTTTNNRIVTSVQGIQKAVNVLLISGTINASTMALRDIFKSDPNSNLVHMMAMRLPADFDDTPRSDLAITPFRLRSLEEALPKFDLIVFDHYPDLNVIPFRYMKEIVKRIENGGATLILAGPDFAGPRSLSRTSIGPILPVKPTGAVSQEESAPQATVEGQRHPILHGLPGVNALPGEKPGWGPWVDTIGSVKLKGTTLLETPDGQPLLVLDHAGKGRVAVLLNGGFSLWKSGYKGGGPYTELMQRLSHWLMKNPNLEEEALKLTAGEDGARIFIERRTMAETADPVTIITPDGEEVSVSLQKKEPGLWTAELETKKTGIYQARQEGTQTFSAFTHIGPANPHEMEHVVSTGEYLKPLSDKTGGTVMRMQDGTGNLIHPKLAFVEPDEKAPSDDTLAIRHNTQTILRGAQTSPLIPGWLGVLMIAGLAATGWVREGDPKRLKASFGAFLRGNTSKQNGPQGPEAGV
ncbi:MAG: hypothetical protein LRY39_00345 [Alphaproteobacteria bacterium]|nr:hypothetical protein [Alphaproteobacteria bacterium]